MEIMREKSTATERQWRVRVASMEYKVRWKTEPVRWDVMVQVKSKSESGPPHWRSIKGQWIINAVRTFESA